VCRERTSIGIRECLVVVNNLWSMSLLLFSWVAALGDTVPDKDKCLTQKTYTRTST
jgi:hypothetical protein